MSRDEPRVAVVGAGISGLAVALDLVTDHEVVVLEQGGIAGDTTSRASGMISLPLEPIPNTWVEVAREFFQELDGHGTFGFTERETVRLVPEPVPSDAEEWEGQYCEYLDATELEARYPRSFADLEDVVGGLVYEGTGYLDVLDYAMTLKWSAEQAGAAIYRDHAVTDLRVEEGRVAGVETEYGSIDADHVVWATGWRAREQLADHVALPVRPLRWNAVVLEPASSTPAGMPLGSDPATRTYWRPTPQGDLLVGGNEHLVDDPEGTPPAVAPDFREVVTSEVAPRLTGFEDARIRREDCCPTADSASPDGLPIVDAPPEGPDGLVVVTGLHGRGVMLSPVTARVVRSLVTGEPAPFTTADLRLARFEDRSADFEYRSHWEA